MTPAEVAVPKVRPKLTHAEAMHRLRAVPVDVSRPVLLAIRGYYLDTMGAVGANDRGMYDDAIFLVTPSTIHAYNANTDPSRDHPNVATLAPGVWLYRIGTHGLSKPLEKQYRALVQAADVTVTRSPDNHRDTGRFGINIHRGSLNSTSSEGCQTIYPLQWDGFIGDVASALHAAERNTIEYVLQTN